MKHVIFTRGREGEIRYLVFSGEVQTDLRVLEDNELVFKVKKFEPIMAKDISYSNESGWISIPICEDVLSGGLIHIADEEDPGEEIRKALKQQEHAMDLLLLAALLSSIWLVSRETKLSAVVIPWRFALSKKFFLIN